MKYTVLYLKYVLLILLAIIMIFSGICGFILVVVSVFATLSDKDASFLLLIIPGLLCGFICSITLDCVTYIVDNWRLKI